MADRSAEFQPLKMGVGTVIWKKTVDGERMFLMGKRNTNPVGKWALPGGTMDDEVSNPKAIIKDKNIRAAAVREILEESGIFVDPNDLRITSVDDKDVKNSRYMNFGFQIEVPLDTEIDMSKATHGHEMSEWRWFREEELDPSEIFSPCIPTIKGFSQNKFQAK